MKNRFIGKLPCCKWASLIAQLVKNLPACRRPRSDSWVRKICWGRDRLPIPVFLGFPCGSAGKESACNVGDLGSIPGLRRSPGEGKGYPLKYSGLDNSRDCKVHGVAESDTTEQLSLSLWTVAWQAPLSMEFSWQEYWSGLPLPSPGNLPDARIDQDLLRFLHCKRILYC